MTDTSDPTADLTAMQQVSAALAPLDDEARRRVVGWAVDAFKIAGFGKSDVRRSSTIDEDAGADRTPRELSEDELPKDFPMLFAEADPSTDEDRLLTAFYWLQVVEKKDPLSTQPANVLLKNVGHYNATANKSVAKLLAEKPAPLVQVSRKGSGTTKQSRRMVRLTTAGIRRVNTMLAR